MALRDIASRRSRDDSEGKYRAKNQELFSREIKADKNSSDKIYSRDVDNLYPLRIEKIINNSPTGRRCANLMSKYIAGNGNGENYFIGGGLYINDIIRKASRSISYQYGAYFRIKYVLDTENMTGEGGILFKPSSLEVLDYVSMAKSKEDDDDFPGKYYLIEDDCEGGLSQDDELKIWYYPFSKNNDVIKAQMLNDARLKEIDETAGWESILKNYRGQVFYLNLTPEYVYALPLGDSVYNDMDTEFRISNYNNTQTRKGFLGKTIVIKYEEDEEDSDDFADELKNFLGSENSSSAFVVEVPQNINTELEKAFLVKQLEAQFDDKLFESTIKNLRQNIMGAFNNIPEPLIFSGSGSLFGTNSDTYIQMKKFYWEQNEYERSQLEQALNFMGYPISIVPIVEESNQINFTKNGDV